MTISFKDLGNQGRLGNQIFRMATTIALALENNDTYVFPPWKYESHFNLQNCFSNVIANSETYYEPYFHWASITHRPNLNLSGYFQSWRYFQKYEGEIKRLFMPNDNLPLQNATSIHVRRGDYLQFADCHPTMTANYYNEAMRLCPSEKYYVFSDDINWCRHAFIGPQFEFISDNNETTDLEIQAKCQNNIICNSSYSWWAAYLNPNPYKIVIAPRQWFGPKLQHNTRDLIPPTWITI